MLVDDTVQLDKLVSEAESLVDRRNPEALALAEDAMTLAVQSGKHRHILYAKYIIASYRCFVSNDYEKAISLCKECEKELSEEGMEELGYKIYMTLGNAYQLQGDVFAAHESYLRGLKQLEARKTLNKREKGFLAAFYYNVSLLLSTSELKIPAEEYLEKAIEIYKEMDNDFKLSKCYVAYSGVFERKKEYVKAIEILNKAREIDEKRQDPYSMALTSANLGIQHLRIARLDTAYNYLKDSLEYFQSHQMTWETAMVKIHFGETLLATGENAAGAKQLLDAETLFDSLENKSELSKVYQLLANYYSGEGLFSTAFAYQTKYTESLKYYFDLEKTKALTRAKKEFETEQKDKEALLLKEKNEEIGRHVRKLEISNNELKQFAHVASHDLKEPLRMIHSYMNLVKRSLGARLSEQENEFFAFALDGAKRMEQLIVDLLQLAKIDSNPQIEKVNMQTILSVIRMNLETLVQEKNGNIVSAGLPEIMANRTQMLQLFQNLIGNGIKYNKNERPLVRVKYLRYADTLHFLISDNGIGIPENQREKVFQIFQRLHTKEEYSGSGIGLAICKKIVEGMHGKISIQPNPSGGTIFNIAFPASICAA